MKQLIYIVCITCFAFACEERIEAIDMEHTISSFEVDGEEIVVVGDRTSFQTSDPDLTLGGGECQSDEFSRSGNYCIKLDSVNPYSLVFELSNLKAGEYIYASVWQKEGSPEGALFVELIGENSAQSVRTFYSKCIQREEGWVQHNISFSVSPGINQAKFNVFSGRQTAYFDDFKFEKSPSIPENDLPAEIAINFNPKSAFKFSNLIDQARQSPVIKDEYKKYVKAQLVDGLDTAKIKIKIKGDWSDHLSSGKISGRIKMRGNSAYHGMKTFSLHHPKTRNYLGEWIAHQLAEQEDVLTTNYDFINVKVNGVRLGIYALEEHFDKQLLESRKRREGPILKLDETGVWELIYAEMMQGEIANLPFYEASVVNMFKQNRTLSTPSLKNNFIEGAKLLTAFKNRVARVDEIFDLDQLAKYHVIIDLVGGVHAMAWHNRRFYYNPITEQIEHILYDVMPFEKDDHYINSMLFHISVNNWKKEDALLNTLVLSPAFKESYLFHLDRMTQVDYIDSFYSSIQSDLSLFESALKQEESYYSFDREKLKEMARYHQSILSDLDEVWENYLRNNSSPQINIAKQEMLQAHDSINFEHISLNAYLGDSTERGFEVLLENYQLGPIEICGYASPIWKKHAFQIESFQMSGFNDLPDSAILYTPNKPEQLFYKISNYPNRYYSAKVQPWKKPVGKTARQKLATTSNWKNVGEFSNNALTLNGQIVLDTLIYLPKGVKLIIKEGTSIELVNNGGIIVNGDLEAIATTDNPIHIFSTSEENNGLTVLQPEKVRVQNIELTALSNLNVGRWMLTGGFTIYECPDIEIHNCKISEGRSEDALNIIRSHFAIEGLSIDHCYSDAFDADFCTGQLSQSDFKFTGNDCIDFSGSQVEIREIEILHSGDKGISGGEDSQLTVENISINGAITGIASKDKSVVTGRQVKIEKVEYALMAFQKKAEYGPARLELLDVNFDWDQANWVLGKGSTIVANGESRTGNTEVDVDALYARFE